MRILVVEDEHRISEGIKRGLMQEGYAVDTAYTGTDGYDLASTENYDVIVMDIMLPGMDGLEVTKSLRSDGIHSPILLLTARTQIGDRVTGLDSGADDYLPKPFAFEELLARIRSLLRRPNTLSATVLKSGRIRLDPNEKKVLFDNQQVTLTLREYALIEYMLRQTNRTISKDEIIAHVWNYDADVLPNTVEAYIKRLRKKLSEESIITVRGFGYKLGV